MLYVESSREKAMTKIYLIIFFCFVWLTKEAIAQQLKYDTIYCNGKTELNCMEEIALRTPYHAFIDTFLLDKQKRKLRKLAFTYEYDTLGTKKELYKLTGFSKGKGDWTLYGNFAGGWQDWGWQTANGKFLILFDNEKRMVRKGGV